MRVAHIFISGFVQGVGFRAFVKRQATRFGLKGWVKNLPDERVEALLQGDEENIHEVIESLNRGPFLAEIEDVVVEWEEPEEISEDFSIVH
ncbi:MAG: hypothetical protein A2857_05640 [Candidatus Levybacteria bacterium RIFCSPHIGHO2_01_FULL_36_15]|nr:MAG: hypothetical protein A2857_05640 [Candidatus Levybacteria bacterium RIFCSPHIGHO2_01_FULL_36_15]